MSRVERYNKDNKERFVTFECVCFPSFFQRPMLAKYRKGRKCTMKSGIQRHIRHTRTLCFLLFRHVKTISHLMSLKS